MAKIINYSPSSLKMVCERLFCGEVGIIPSDTIYGISSLLGDEQKRRIFDIKKRSEEKSLIVLSDFKNISSVAVGYENILSLWPNPLTVILNKIGGGTIAVRIPKDDYLLSLIKEVGNIYSTSVNVSGSPALNSFNEIFSLFNDKVDFIVNREDVDRSTASTILDATTHPYKIIRQGDYRVDKNLLV